MIRSVADIVRVHGRSRPDAPALIVGDATITYGELDARSSRVAQAFAHAGVGFGDRVAFIERNGAEFFEVMFGLAKLGAVGVPVNWRLAAPEMRTSSPTAAPRPWWWAESSSATSRPSRSSWTPR